MFDNDGNGNLSRVEFHALLETVGSTLTPEETDVTFAKADTNQDGSLQADELSALFASQNQRNCIKMKSCPYCHEALDAPDINQVLHLSACMEKVDDPSSHFAMSGFLNNDFAAHQRRNLFGSAISSEDQYQKNQDYLAVLDRKSGAVEQEAIPAYVKTSMRIMYATLLGRGAVDLPSTKKLLGRMTEQYGVKYEDPKSVGHIAPFIKMYNLNMNEYAKPSPDQYTNFNEFFAREILSSARPVSEATNANVAVCAADSRLVVFPNIVTATQLWVKGDAFTLQALVGDATLAAKYEGGSMALFRLAPQDYHRFHCPVDGTLVSSTLIDGTYYTVNPIAIRRDVNVFTENKRVVNVFNSTNFGTVCQVAVGATMVGSISISMKPGHSFKKGDELGQFRFGGSTTIVLFEPGQISFDLDLVTNSSKPIETLVQMGSHLGVHH
jgi:phosphatidylserine decarboxylase